MNIDLKMASTGVTGGECAQLILPRVGLAGCVFAAIMRDTRAVKLRADQRFNFFPASPYCTVSLFFDGSSNIVDVENFGSGDFSGTPMGQMTFSGPQSHPLVSWNPDHVYAISIGFYPEAWQVLSECNAGSFVDQTVPLERVASGALLQLFADVIASEHKQTGFEHFQDGLEKLWKEQRSRGIYGFDRMGDWIRALAMQAATSGVGRSARQIQRRIKEWTGQTHRDLSRYSRVENLFELVTTDKGTGGRDLAGLSVEAGFSDQSHMGREVRRVTGMSPQRLNRYIKSDEAFWCYRLLGERF